MAEETIGAPGRAIVLEPSLAFQLPDKWAGRLTKRCAHHLGGLREVMVLEYSIEAGAEEHAAFELAERLGAPGYYAHLLRGDSMIVVFPRALFLLRRDDSEMIRRCRAFGRTLDIPDSQMQFERMFDNDHPDLIEPGS